MAKKPNIHVVTHPDGWAVKKAGAQKASAVTNTQKEAIAIAKEIAKETKTELVIHGKNGEIRTKDSFGNDPNPPKDKG